MNTPIEDFKTRFNKAISMRNIKPAELADKTGLSKSTISHYMSGYTKPKSDKLFVLAKVLDVREQWLMGLNVPMERRSLSFHTASVDCPFNSAMAKLQNSDCDLTREEQEAIEKELPKVMGNVVKAFNDCYYKISNLYEKERIRQLFESFRLLNDAGKTKAIEQISLLTKIPDYQTLDYSQGDTFSNIVDLEPIHKTRRSVYTYYQRLASAGTGEYIFDDIPTDTIEAPYMEYADFIIGVKGDSMEPTYYDGDKVYVEKRQVIEIGEIGIFMINNECFIKEAGRNGLISHNKKYRMIPGSEHIICVGRVLGRVDE